MLDMRTPHSERADLNLFLIFEALMAERNVTAASDVLGLTQPTVSHALNRLRRMCGDQLFVRTATGMQPTAYAMNLAPPIIQALDIMRRAMENRDQFDPATDRRLFKVLLTDIGTVTFLPPLLRLLDQAAPGVRIETSQIPLNQYKEALQSGAIELAIGQMPSIIAGFYQQRIFEDSYVGVVAASNTSLSASPTLEEYLAARHVRVQIPGRPQSAIDQALVERSLERNVIVTVGQYLALRPVLLSSELVATVPHDVFLAMGQREELRMFELPFPVEPIVIRQFWHERNHNEPGLAWLRNMIVSTMSGRKTDRFGQTSPHES